MNERVAGRPGRSLRIIAILGVVGDLLVLQLSWIVASLAVVTAVPAAFALQRCLAERMDEARDERAGDAGAGAGVDRRPGAGAGTGGPGRPGVQPGRPGAQPWGHVSDAGRVRAQGAFPAGTAAADRARAGAGAAGIAGNAAGADGSAGGSGSGDLAAGRGFFRRFVIALRALWPLGIAGPVALAVFIISVLFWASAEGLPRILALAVLLPLGGVALVVYLGMLGAASTLDERAGVRELARAGWAAVLARPLRAAGCIVLLVTWLLLLTRLPTLLLITSGVVPALAAYWLTIPPREGGRPARGFA